MIIRNLHARARGVASTVLAHLRAMRFQQRQKGFVPHVIDRTVYGEPVKLWIADTDGRDWYENSSYLVESWPEIEFLKDRMVRPGDIVLECGAHQGLTAVLLSRWVGENGKVIAIDPVRHNVGVIEKNLELNAAGNVEIVHAAVGDRPGQTRIAGGTNIQIGQAVSGAMVDMVTIDSFAGRRPTLLKIDIEGAEGLAFEGAAEVMETRPRILLELHTNTLPTFGTDAKSIMNELWSRDYETWVLWEDFGTPEPLPRGTAISQRVHIFGFPA